MRYIDMEKRYPYKTSWPWLSGVLLLIGVFTACVLLLVRDPNGGHTQPRTALIVGLSISERCLPGKEEFDEIYSHIQSRVE